MSELTTKAVRDVIDDNAFWSEMRQLVLTGALASARKLVAQGIEAAASVGVIVDFDAIHQEAVAITRRWTDSWWEQLDKTTRAGLREAILQWETVGLGKRGLPDLIDAIEPLFGKARAKRIAVTEATRLFAEGNKLAVQGDDSVGGLQWQTAEDERVCPLCAPHNNEIFPKDQALTPPLHVNCLLPGNEVVAPGLMAAMRSWYEGPALELRTVEGHKLSVTPNHPILTSRGFIPAQLLHEGDEVVYCAYSQGVSSGANPNAHDRPTPIEEIWSSLFKASSMRSGFVPSSPLNFHRDGRFVNGNIEIVGTDSFLKGYLDPSFSKHIRQNKFCRRSLRQALFASESTPDFFVQAMDSALRRLMSSLALGLAHLWRHLLPLQCFGFGLRSGRYALVQQATPYHIAVNAIGVAKSQLRFTRQISRGDFGIRRCSASLGYALGIGAESPDLQAVLLDAAAQGPLRHTELGAEVGHSLPSKIAGNHLRGDRNFLVDALATACRHAQAVKPAADTLRLDAERGRQILDSLSGQVATDKLIEIRALHFKGHVYDLQTKDGWYTAGIHYSVSNCRCSILPASWRYIRQQPGQWQGGPIPPEAP